MKDSGPFPHPISERQYRALFRFGIIGIVPVTGYWYWSAMWNKPRRQELHPLTVNEAQTRTHLQAHVQTLAAKIGGRDTANYQNLCKAADYIEEQLRASGYTPARQIYKANGRIFANLCAELGGTKSASASIVIGAHYDTAGGLPGANDNASGVAAVLELARQFAGNPQPRPIRWVLFVNEEPPYFQTTAMGSYVYAKGCRERDEKIAAMLSLETIGYYSDEPGSQAYPVGFHPGYPDRGDYLGFVSDMRSALLLQRVLRAFRKGTTLPAEGAAMPSSIPGAGWSDHWSFWQFGYRALMVTDTAPFRYPYYHTAQDTPDKLDYDRMTRAVTGLAATVRTLAGA